MIKKNGRNTKGRIVSAAWRLFYEQGYENTTIEDIVYESGTSKGSFYHYFSSKDELLASLSMIFDEKYEELEPLLSPQMSASEKLVFLDRELLALIDNSISLELLARLFSSQLITRGGRHLLDRSRTYFRLLYRIVREGQEAGQLRTDMTANEIVHAYAMFERALIYDWCLSEGSYALSKYAAAMMPLFLKGFTS